jgi:hypothetical protein
MMKLPRISGRECVLGFFRLAVPTAHCVRFEPNGTKIQIRQYINFYAVVLSAV